MLLFQEAYRRWVCSTLIPYFAEPADIRPKRDVNRDIINNSTNIKVSNQNFKNKGDSSTTSLQIYGEDPLLSRVLNR